MRGDGALNIFFEVNVSGEAQEKFSKRGFLYETLRLTTSLRLAKDLYLDKRLIE